jgi:beta-glucosidase
LVGDRAEQLLQQLSLEEKVTLVAGVDFWHTPSVPRLGIPALKVTDGPNGARGEDWTGGPSSACFPCGVALAATWDVDLVREVGVELGEETRSKGAHVLLAPTVNIHRTPLAGRTFECYSEDPHLAARVAVAFIEGVQSRGVGTAVKHFVCNDSEFERMTISSDVGERALREIYLPPFEAATTEAGSWTVMAAYNRVNGTYSAEHPRLLTTILRDEWGWDGAVLSDWFGTRSTVAAANAGLDLEMPGPPVHMGKQLLDAVRSGAVEEKTLDDKVRRLLVVLERAGALDRTEPVAETFDDRPERRTAIRRAAAAAIVLLRNERAVLPLDASALRRIAVIGPNAAAARMQGGGSAGVFPAHAVTPLDGVRSRVGDGVVVVHEPGCVTTRAVPLLDTRTVWTVEYFAGPDRSGPPVHTTEHRRSAFRWTGPPHPELAGSAWSARITAAYLPEWTGTHTFKLRSAAPARLFVDDALVVDGADAYSVTASHLLAEARPHQLRLELGPPREGSAFHGTEVRVAPPPRDDLLERAVAAATAADVAVVVVGLDDEWETEGRDRADLSLPGGQAELVEQVAAVNPRTVVIVNAGAPVTMDWADHVPAVLQLWYPGQEGGDALADVLFGDVNPSGRLPLTFPQRLEDTPAYLNDPGEAGHVLYGEGVFVGYRFYEARRIEPRFAFGHGLSYTTFAYGDLAVRDRQAAIEVAVDVTNTGARTGAEVVQLYVRDIEASVRRPEKELRGFAKVMVEPGRTERVHFTLDDRAFAFWDAAAGGWRVEPGEFELLVGPSSADIRARSSYTREESS